MAEIGLDYRDLYLIHAPWPWDEVGKDCREENRQIWKAMEEFLASGRVKAIGISNFGPEDLDSLLPACETKPLVNQIRWFIGLDPSDTVQKCAEHDIVVEAYSPFAHGLIVNHPEIGDIARATASAHPAVHPLPAAEGCRGAAQGDHDPAHQAERRTRLRDFCRRHGRPRRHAGATPRGTRTRWSSAGSDRSLGSSRRSATAREVLAIDQARDDRRGRSRRPRLRPVRLWSLERIPFESRMCCPLGRTQRGTDCRRDAAARDSSSARRHRCTGRLVPESSRPPRRAR
jgi:hypothetical protein